jgi:hypothetical protein
MVVVKEKTGESYCFRESVQKQALGHWQQVPHNIRRDLGVRGGGEIQRPAAR